MVMPVEVRAATEAHKRNTVCGLIRGGFLDKVLGRLNVKVKERKGKAAGGSKTCSTL